MSRRSPSPAPPFDGAYRLLPGIQHYAWGDTQFVPDLLGLPNPDRTPHAEVWMGAHPALPARVSIGGQEIPFDALLHEHGAAFLGPDVTGTFGTLPYLLKILAAAEPLSIQVHPTTAQAEAGFAREAAAGIPRDAPHRCYRDRSHKPEILVALTPFHALCGFRPLDEIAEALDGLAELHDLLPAFRPTPDGLRAIVEAYFNLPDARLLPALEQLVGRVRSESERSGHDGDDPVHWLLRADDTFSQAGRPDRGLLFVLLLELVRLEPGRAMFLPAGTLHAYLHGAGVELMASSDNVLRCGLTPKHVDADELLRIVDFAATGPRRVEGAPGPKAWVRTFRTPAPEFELHELNVTPDRRCETVARGTDTLVAVAGDPDDIARVTTRGGALELPRGGACVVPNGVSYTVSASAPVTVFRATVPAEGAAR